MADQHSSYKTPSRTLQILFNVSIIFHKKQSKSTRKKIDVVDFDNENLRSILVGHYTYIIIQTYPKTLKLFDEVE